MDFIEGTTMGKEQLILLPVQPQNFQLQTDPSVTVTLQTGRHGIVVSGYTDMGFFLPPFSDDDIVAEHDVHFLVGPFWEDLVQVSACVSISSIISKDSDEVDHSLWVIERCTWEVAQLEEGEKIRLKVRLKTQGSDNGWINLAYQVVATGTLKSMPTPDEISADLGKI